MNTHRDPESWWPTWGDLRDFFYGVVAIALFVLVIVGASARG